MHFSNKVTIIKIFSIKFQKPFPLTIVDVDMVNCKNEWSLRKPGIYLQLSIKEATPVLTKNMSIREKDGFGRYLCHEYCLCQDFVCARYHREKFLPYTDPIRPWP